MTKNLSPEEETELLEEGTHEDQPQGNLLIKMLTSLNNNMSEMSESLKRLHNDE